MFPLPWYNQYTCYMHMYDVRTCVFFGSVCAHARIVLVHIRWFSFHTQRGQLADSACIARNKKRLASRLARSLRSQSVINTAHYQRFKKPHVTRSPPIGIAKLSKVFMNSASYTRRASECTSHYYLWSLGLKKC